MTSDTPGSGTPGWGRSPDQGGQAPASGEWPAELAPPAEAPGAPADAPEPAAAADAPTQPVVPGAWSQPAAPAPVAPSPAPAAATTDPLPPPVAQPAWGTPTAQPPQPGQPPTPGYGAPVPPAASGGGQWAAPPPQQPGSWPPPGGASGAPGGPPVGWQPAPAKSSNGCLKACLIVGIIFVILAVIFFVAITILGMRFASDLGMNADGSMQECSFVSNDELAQVLDGRPTGMPLGGLVDATLGQLLDQRLLAEADDCWLLDESGSGYTGRLAFQPGGSFEQERALAEAGAFLAVDVPGYGAQAFCTGMAETGSTGALVGEGGDLAYVSLIAGSLEGFDLSEAPNGVLYSPAACEQAAAIAAQILR